jgi:hypothetical protein
MPQPATLCVTARSGVASDIGVHAGPHRAPLNSHGRVLLLLPPPHLQGWKLDAGEFPAVAKYMETLATMPAWQHTLPDDGDAVVVAGWGKHISG